MFTVAKESRKKLLACLITRNVIGTRLGNWRISPFVSRNVLIIANGVRSVKGYHWLSEIYYISSNEINFQIFLAYYFGQKVYFSTFSLPVIPSYNALCSNEGNFP